MSPLSDDYIPGYDPTDDDWEDTEFDDGDWDDYPESYYEDGWDEFDDIDNWE